MTDQKFVCDQLKEFDSLKDMIEEIETKMFYNSGFSGRITTKLANSKEFIKYGGREKFKYSNSLDADDTIIKTHIPTTENNYWRICKKDNDIMPKHMGICLCFHDIKYNCFIKNIKTNKIYVVGRCCIKKFVHKEMAGRRCDICLGPHRNSKNNICFDCRDVIKEKERLESYEKERLERLERYEKEKECVFREDNICKFGKHKSKSYDVIFKDKGYIRWAYKQLNMEKKDNIYYLMKLYKEHITLN